MERLAAAEGLSLVRGETHATIAWGDADAFGPVAFARYVDGGAPKSALELTKQVEVRVEEGQDDIGDYTAWQLASHEGLAPSVRAYRDQPMLVFRIEAATALVGLETGEFSSPSCAWPWLRANERDASALPEDTQAFAHSYTEFALPTYSDPSCARFFMLTPFRPAVVAPLSLIAPDGRCLVVAPLDAFHEQVIAVPDGEALAERGVRCGWHGDLANVHEGFASEVAVFAAPDYRSALERWAGILKRRAHTRRPSRYADAGVGQLSYWTDNGAAYWYRCEPGKGIEETLESVAHGFERDDIPVAAWELDSWFYPHEFTRRFDAPPDEVPPSGCMIWEPREDALPGGIGALRQKLGSPPPPLILHARHYSSESPYLEHFECWVDADRAHPKGPALFDQLCNQAADWGAIQIEQDWMVESFMGVRGLREAPGRAAAWQRGMNESAREHGLHLVWCMSTPADFCESVNLDRVAAIRTSGDYRYRIGNAALWCWYLYNNALARAFGLLPFKDVFLSRRDGEGTDGDPLAEAEALLSALSAGPVGIGDRADRTDRAIVMRTCREDGVLVKPDVPLAALARSFRKHAHLNPEPLLAESYSDHPAGRWVYLVGLNAYQGDEDLRYHFALEELGEVAPTSEVVAYDWRARSFEPMQPGDGFRETLAPRDWSYRVLCPWLAGGIALVGDPTRYATAGDRRIRDVRETESGIGFDVLGAPGEAVELLAYTEALPRDVRGTTPGGDVAIQIDRELETGRTAFALQLPRTPRIGWVRVEIEV